VNGEGGKLKEKVEEWKRFMLENPPPMPEAIKFPEEWDYYDKEYVRARTCMTY